MAVPVILYVEVPCFYAEIERARQASDPERPIIVGGDPRKRGQVQSASPEALRVGVREGMSMQDALQLCTRARPIRTDMRHYREVAGSLRSTLRGVLDALEPCGLAGAYLDGSHRPESPEELAAAMRGAVAEELSLPLRVGIAPVKFLARLAAEEAGPDVPLRIRPGEETRFLSPLELARLPGVGPKTALRLAELGARSVAELLSVAPSRLEEALGNHGLRILEHARGFDPQPVRVARAPGSLSQESRFETPQLDREVIWDRLQGLALGLEESLQRQQLSGRRVAVKLRFEDGETTTRQKSLPSPTSSSTAIYEAAVELLERTQAGVRPLGGVGISLGGISRGAAKDPQLELFPGSR